MKKIYSLACLLLMALGASAQQAAMRVWTSQEQSTLFVFSAQPTVAFTSAGVQVKAAETEMVIDKHDYVKFTFEESDIDDGVKSVGDGPVVRFADNGFEASRLKAGSPVRVYNLSGALVASAVADGDGRVCVSLGNLPTGVYVVHSQAGVFKVLKK